MSYYLQCWQKYATFAGRARRKEIWMFYIFSFLVALVLNVIECVIGLPFVLSGIYYLAVFLPSWAVSVRRLHDTRRSGWWLLISLIPFIGGLILFIFLYCLDSEPGDNIYGKNPKGL